jgi:hypothetical protein
MRVARARKAFAFFKTSNDFIAARLSNRKIKLITYAQTGLEKAT